MKNESVPPLQPLLLTGGILRSYQLEGMTWLLGLFEHGINGILADEMVRKPLIFFSKILFVDFWKPF